MTTQPEYAAEPLPPHDLDAEAALLGSMFLDPDLLPDVRPVLGPRPFFSEDHQAIYESLNALHDARLAADAVTVRAHLKRRGVWDDVGGAEMLAAVIGSVFTASTGRHYAGIVGEKARLRELIALCNRVLRRASAPSRDDRSSALCREIADAAAAVQDRGQGDTIRTLEEALHDTLDSLGKKEENRLPFGLADLDDFCGGAPVGGYTMVAAAPGMGKSAFTKQAVLNAAAMGVPCGIIAAEESVRKVACNYLSNASGIENRRLMFNRLAGDDWKRLYGVVPALAALPVFIDDAQRRLSAVEACARKLVRKHGCRLIVVDHIHLLDGETDANRTQEVGKVSKALKSLFKELKVAGLVVAQLNRSGDPRNPPELRHLRESGDLEADGDLILMLHREDYFRWKDDPENFSPDHRLRVYVNKNKDAGMGWVDTYFDGDTQSVRDWNGGFGGTRTRLSDPEVAA